MKAVILDTGCANLASLAFAVKRLGVEPLITREAADIRSADRIFLPGVGTAKAAMTALTERGLPELIRPSSRFWASVLESNSLAAAVKKRAAWICSASLMRMSANSMRPDCRFRTWGGTESFLSSNPRRPNCFLRTSNLENGSILSTALQCLTALPPLLPAHTESRLPPPLPAKTSWACSSTQSARAKRALVFSLIFLEPPHDYSCH